MTVREFSDGEGKAWRAWEIRPEDIHPATKGEDYLADCYVIGWIVFETLAADEKRRLCPYPTRWAKATDGQLRELLARAERVAPRKLDADRHAAEGISPAPVAGPDLEDTLDITDLHVVRSFRYPGGRLWTVCVVEYPEDGGPRALRFTAGMRTIDLRPWPKDWVDAPNPRLIEMLRRAAPRTPSAPQPGTPQRRWNDRPTEASPGR